MPSYNKVFVYSDEVITEQLNAKSEVRKLKREQSMQAADSLKQSLSISFQRSMDLAQERDALSWLTSFQSKSLDLLYI